MGKQFPPRKESGSRNGHNNSSSRPYQRYQKNPHYKRPVYYYNAVCTQCDRRIRVPFKPDGIRPVYCKECFKKVRYMQLDVHFLEIFFAVSDEIFLCYIKKEKKKRIKSDRRD